MFVRQWRLHRGLTQNQLASRLGISTASISRIESGRFSYTRSRLEKIAAALNCTPAGLLGSDPASVEGKIWMAMRAISPRRRPLVLQLLVAVATADKADEPACGD